MKIIKLRGASHHTFSVTFTKSLGSLYKFKTDKVSHPELMLCFTQSFMFDGGFRIVRSFE